MSRVLGPLLSVKASGSYANTLIFQTRQGQPRVMFKYPHRPSRSALQQKIRAIYGEAISEWRRFTDEERAPWNEEAKKLGISGVNLLLKKMVARRYPVAYERIGYAAGVYSNANN